MALIWDDMPCAICGKPILADQRMFATTAHLELYRRFPQLNDTAAHQACINEWSLRDKFIEFYNEHCKNELYVDKQGNVAYRRQLRFVEDCFFSAILIPIIPCLAADFYQDSRATIALKVATPILLVIGVACLSSFYLTPLFVALFAALTWVALIPATLLYMYWQAAREKK